MAEDEALAPVYNSPTEMVNGDGEKKKGGGVELEASIGLFGGCMIIVGCIIGSGIFVAPKGVHENAGSLGFSLVIWVVCGIFSAIGAYCYAELGTFITKSGGDYAYVFVSFGPFMAFLRMWIECIIVRPCTMTVVAMTFALYILRPFYPHCDPPSPAPQLLAAGCLILLTVVNIMSVKLVTMVQNIFTVAKLFALFLIIVTGIVLLCMGGVYTVNFENAWEGTNLDPGNIALAFYSGLWAYNGWNYLNFVTEELENPKRNLPLAIAISMAICMVFYVMTNIAFYAGVSIDELIDSPAVAVTFANQFYGVMAWIMPVFVAMSCFGTVNGVLLTSSRLFFVAGRERHMPHVLSMINPYLGTPVPSILFCGILSLLYLTMANNIYTLINYVQIVNWLAIAVAACGLVYLRHKMPPSTHPRPLQVNIIFPIIFILGCIFLVVFPMYQKPMDALIGLGIMLSGVPVYFLFIYWQNKPKWFVNAVDSFTLGCQKTMLVVAGAEKKD